MTLADLFDLSFVGRHNQPAIAGNPGATFGALDAAATRMAHALAARGVSPGVRVALYLRNSIELITIYVAALRLGAVIVPLNILYRDRELGHILADAEPLGVVAAARDARFIPPGAPVWDLDELVRDSKGQPERAIDRITDGDAAALVIYTSGTTGAPKGAVLTHNMLAANALTLVTCWQITSADRLHLTLPLFHVHGLCVGLHSWLISGCVMRLEERFDHHAIAAQMLDFQPTLFFGVPTMYVLLIETDEGTARTIGGGMRLFVSGSAPLPAGVWHAFRDRFGHAILERYGMSETLMNISNPYIGERRPGSVGLPLPGVSVRIAGAGGESVPDGESGEVWIKGPNVIREYWRNPKATAAAFRDGWFMTGDLGTRSPDGYITLQGRRSDLIISGGFNIYPREIEDFLCEQPGVAEAAVVGVADPVRGQVPVAFVVADAGWRVEEVEHACRAHLASFKVPRRFVVVDRLPRTALGKVQKRALAERFRRES